MTDNNSINKIEAFRNVRVFVSSTFNNMMEERDYLARQTFPAIKSLAHHKDITFQAIDLRWGITEEESHAKGVVKACLDEIDRSNPFFIGIIGDRYGWTPDFNDFGSHCQEFLDRAPWLTDAVNGCTSITEIEFLYGALERKDSDTNAWFYIKSGTSDDPRVETLKKKVLSQDRFPVKYYDSPEELGRLVYEDVTKRLSELFPEDSFDSFEHERKRHEFILNENLQKMIEFPEYIYKALDKWAFQDDKARPVAQIFASNRIKNGRLSITVCGKSMLLCHYVSMLRSRNYDCIYIDTAVCEGDIVDSCRNYIQNWLDRRDHEGAAFIAIDNADFYTDDENRRFVALINELSLSHRVILSAHTFAPNLHVDTIYCPLLPDESIDRMIDKYFSLHGKKINAEDLALLPHDPYRLDDMKRILDHLVRFGSYEKLSMEIKRFNETTGYSLTWILIEDIQNDIGNMRTGNWEAMWILNAIFMSGDAGLSEDEIIALTNISPMRWSMIRGRILEICHRRGEYYMIYGNERNSTECVLRDKYYTNFRDLVIERIIYWLTENPISIPRLALMLTSLHFYYIGAENNKEKDARMRQSQFSVYRDIRLVNAMSYSDLIWFWKNRSTQMREGPVKWTGFKSEPEYSDAEMLQYYERMAQAAKDLMRTDDYNYYFEKLLPFYKDEGQIALMKIENLIFNGHFDDAVRLKGESRFPQKIHEAKAGLMITRELFRRMFFDKGSDEMEALMDIVDKIDDVALVYDIRALGIEFSLIASYFCGDKKEIEEVILPTLLELYDEAVELDIPQSTRIELCRLLGYSNMMTGNYTNGMRQYLDPCVNYAINRYGHGSPAFSQAMITYGLGFTKIKGEEQNAYTHIRDCNVKNHKAEKLINPWMINALYILHKMSFAYTDVKTVGIDKLKEIHDFIHQSPDNYDGYNRDLINVIAEELGF